MTTKRAVQFIAAAATICLAACAIPEEVLVAATSGGPKKVASKAPSSQPAQQGGAVATGTASPEPGASVGPAPSRTANPLIGKALKPNPDGDYGPAACEDRNDRFFALGFSGATLQALIDDPRLDIEWDWEVAANGKKTSGKARSNDKIPMPDGAKNEDFQVPRAVWVERAEGESFRQWICTDR